MVESTVTYRVEKWKFNNNLEPEFIWMGFFEKIGDILMIKKWY